MSLTVFSVIRNGIENGYPFVESYASWLPYCDRVFVLEGESDDGTDLVLERLAQLSDRFEWESAPWPGAVGGGRSIADFTNEALSRAGDDRLMYVQADEIYTEEQRRLVAGSTETGLEFAGCVNFWNSTDSVVGDEFPMRYIRLLPPASGARAVGDGFTFEVARGEIRRISERILHYGWCFPVNILQKHVNHARIYRDDLRYQARGRLATLMLRERNYDRRMLDALAPQYHPVSYEGTHPACMSHILSSDVYDPYLGLEALAAGARW